MQTIADTLAKAIEAGHSNVVSTYQTYARFAPNHLQEAAEILDLCPNS